MKNEIPIVAVVGALACVALPLDCTIFNIANASGGSVIVEDGAISRPCSLPDDGDEVDPLCFGGQSEGTTTDAFGEPGSSEDSGVANEPEEPGVANEPEEPGVANEPEEPEEPGVTSEPEEFGESGVPDTETDTEADSKVDTEADLIAIVGENGTNVHMEGTIKTEAAYQAEMSEDSQGQGSETEVSIPDSDSDTVTSIPDSETEIETGSATDSDLETETNIPDLDSETEVGIPDLGKETGSQPNWTAIISIALASVAGLVGWFFLFFGKHKSKERKEEKE